MKLNRLLNDYEFILTDHSQFAHLKLTGDQYIRISELRVNATNYDRFIVGTISDLTISFSDSEQLKDYSYHLNYRPGLIKGLDKLDDLMIQYNTAGENKKAIFQKMVKVGLDFNFKVKNSTKFKSVGKGKSPEFKKSASQLEKLLKDESITFESLKGEFHYAITPKEGHVVVVRIASYEKLPKDTFDKITGLIQPEINELKEKYKNSYLLFYFLNPHAWENKTSSLTHDMRSGDINDLLSHLG